MNSLGHSSELLPGGDGARALNAMSPNLTSDRLRAGGLAEQVVRGYPFRAVQCL